MAIKPTQNTNTPKIVRKSTMAQDEVTQEVEISSVEKSEAVESEASATPKIKANKISAQQSGKQAKKLGSHQPAKKAPKKLTEAQIARMAAEEAKLKSYSRWITRQKILRMSVCIFLCILSIFPFWVMIVNSTRTNTEILSKLTLIPSKYFTTNFKSLLAYSESVTTGIYKAFLNSLTVALPVTIGSIYISSMTAYGITAYKFRGRNFAWSFIMAVLMIPAQVSIFGYFQLVLKLNLYDNFLALIIPALASPSVIFFMRQFMISSLPLEIVDAARIDGSGEFSTFNRIVMPLLLPAIATQCIFIFVGTWNNLFTPALLLSDRNSTVPMFIQTLKAFNYKADYGMIYMALTMSILPIFVVYFLVSKYIIAGVALGGVKE